MKNHKLNLLTVFALVTSTLVFSCQKSSTNDLHDAQLCLNSASAGEAMGCISKISSDTSPLAYSLRCTAVFVSQGFGSAVSFVTALDSINGGTSGCTGGCSSTVSALGALKFEAAGISNQSQWDANNAAAADAFSQCSQADAKIYSQIASLFRLGTMTSMLAYKNVGATYTQDQLAAQLVNLTPQDVGAIVTATYGISCQDTEKASASTKAYCAELAAAIAGGATETQIGQCLIKKLQNPSATCP